MEPARPRAALVAAPPCFDAARRRGSIDRTRQI